MFAAGVCSEGEDAEAVEVRRYVMALLEGFFRHKGPGLNVSDHRLLLGSIFRHLHRRIVKRWPESRPVTDLALMVATSQRLYAARSGRGALFVFRAEKAAALFGGGAGNDDLLGAPSGGGVETAEAPLQAGDMVVLCNPALARVISPRDVSVILGRAREPGKASLFLSAIAERKGAEGVLTALVWEVPNYQGAALLTGDSPPTGGEAGEEEGAGLEAEREEGAAEDHAERAKRQWLSKWRRHREEP
ncbi:MAG: hypothetical protein H5T73_11810 [Actinobacteria bacterium]|nr:hypothetical protein [Actinomycetota bacterium]